MIRIPHGRAFDVRTKVPVQAAQILISDEAKDFTGALVTRWPLVGSILAGLVRARGVLGNTSISHGGVSKA